MEASPIYFHACDTCACMHNYLVAASPRVCRKESSNVSAGFNESLQNISLLYCCRWLKTKKLLGWWLERRLSDEPRRTMDNLTWRNSETESSALVNKVGFSKACTILLKLWSPLKHQQVLRSNHVNNYNKLPYAVLHTSVFISSITVQYTHSMW